MQQLEMRKQSLMEAYDQRKRGSDSSQSSSGLGHSKKPSVCSVDVLTSPPLQKKVARLQEYEEVSVKGKPSSSDSTPSHTHNPKISEMEMRVKEELEAGLSTYRQQQHKRSDEQGGLSLAQTRGKGSSGGGSPRHDRHSPVNKWGGASTSPSEVRPSPAHAVSSHTPPTFGHFPPSPTATRPGRSGFHDGQKSISLHSDSSEWTEFACASTSGGSVEVGGQLLSSVYSSSNSGGRDSNNMAEFDPISTITGDPSKPSRTH